MIFIAHLGRRPQARQIRAGIGQLLGELLCGISKRLCRGGYETGDRFLMAMKASDMFSKRWEEPAWS